MNQHFSATKNNHLPSLKKLHDIFTTDMHQLNSVILSKMQSSVPLIPQLTQHLLNAGGKRLRPHLTLAAAALCDYQGKKDILLAASVELIHTATLLHDDVIDESHSRRGKETANAIWSSKSAILVGDFLFARAFEFMVECQSLKVLETLSSASAQIAEGEVLQLTIVNDLSLSIDTYLQVIEAKTAVLFAAACKAGAELAMAPDPIINHLYLFGKYLGMAFQITDDILDYTAPQQDLGKIVGDDFKEGKVTLPVILTYQQASLTEKEFWKRTITQTKQAETDLTQAKVYMLDSQAFERSLHYAAHYIERAIECLKPFPQTALLEALQDACYFSLHRAKTSLITN